MKKTKTQNGITLIALIITILVLLILAGVAIKSIQDGGLLTQAEKAVSTHNKGEEEEKIQLAYMQYTIEKQNRASAELSIEDARVRGDEANGWTITFDESGNRYTLSSKGQVAEKAITEEEVELKKYLSGESASIDESEMKLLTAATNSTGKGIKVYGYIKYKNKVYRAITEDGEIDLPINVEDLELVYDPDLTGYLGKTVEYGGTSWTVLYDHGDYLELISETPMGSLTLGVNDTSVSGSNDTEKALNSYNNALNRMQSYVETLIPDNDLIVSVRCAGSNPYSTKVSKIKYKFSYNSQFDGLADEGDHNYEHDLIRMCYWLDYNDNSWMASRFSVEIEGKVMFGVHRLYSNQLTNSVLLGAVNIENDTASSNGSKSSGVRPIVKIEKSRFEQLINQ